MTTTGSAAGVAETYVRAWLGGDVEKAMGLIADDIVCQAPSGPVRGADAYRQFLAPFAGMLISGELLGVFGDDNSAAIVYTVDLPFAKDFRGAEYLTVEDGRITHAVSIFDRAPMMQAAGGQD
ncbi:nuclear transport factor 2 family protein [Streptomyces sp. NPDC087787]|uniref:nuclear transport factor 2 family protein n=1 Tax=Streptomyces sp. NPDC087787 TaxID=3365803 RepID=UPI00380042F4